MSGLGVMLAIVAAMGVPGAAGAASVDQAGDITPQYGNGPIVQYGTVAYVADGDTIDVKIAGVKADPGRLGTRIRYLGINAMELYTYHRDLDQVTGECHAVAAAKQLSSMLVTPDGQGRRVRLTAQDASTRNGGRLARYVAVQDADGTWQDTGAAQLADGLALADYENVNYENNREYRQLAETAAAQGAGLWDTDSCGSGPAADVSIKVNWDAPGNDGDNVNGEYIKITNHGHSRVNLAGWWVRDSAGRPMPTLAESKDDGYILPKGAVVPAGGSIKVRVGKGTTSTSKGRYYYGLSKPIFDNQTGAPTYMGDGGYLFDPQGDLRHWQQYPCVSKLAHACAG